MTSWFSMPTELRNDTVKNLLLARRTGNIPAFCDAYTRYLGKNIARNWLELIETARGGDQHALHALWLLLLNGAAEIAPITDPEVTWRLAMARAADFSIRSDAREDLYTYLERLVDEYRTTRLYDNQATAPAEPVELLTKIASEDGLEVAITYLVRLTDALKPSSTDTIETWQEWDRLASTIGASAERLWRDVFLETDFTKTPASANAGSLERITETAHRLMLLWLEASLYRQRSYYNGEGRNLRSGGSIRKQIQAYVNKYHAILRRWDKELFEIGRKHYFIGHSLESQQLRRLIRQFSELNPQELGWASQATDARDELRYQLRDEMRHEALTKRKPFAALGLLILKFTTGYGTRPIYFLYTALWALGIDTVLFLLNDRFHSWLDPQGPACVLSQPPSQQWSDVVPFVLNSLMHYLYLAATTLTSLGADTSLVTYCHSWSSQALLVVSAAFGYFMLGLLGALLFTQLTERD